MPRGTTYQNYQIFFSREPMEADIRQAVDTYGVRHILSLDRDVAQRVATRLRDMGLQNHVTQTVHHISPNSPGGEGQILFDNIKGFLQKKPILIHCLQGQDRTGFALASWLIKERSYNPCQAVKEVESVTGYGKGISPAAKETLNRILGCINEGETETEMSIEDAKDLINGDVSLDSLEADDIVTQMRDNFSHQQGWPSSGTVDSGPIGDNVWHFNNSLDSSQSMYPGNEPTSSEGSAINVAASNVIIRSASRKKVLNKILKLINELIEEDSDENDAWLGQGITGFDELPGSTGPIAVEFPHQPKGAGGVGSVDNYAGVGANNFNNPSGCPGAPNGAAPVDSAGYLQL